MGGKKLQVVSAILIGITTFVLASCSPEERGTVDQGTKVVTERVTVVEQAPSEAGAKTTAPTTTDKAATPETTIASQPTSPDLVIGDTVTTAAGNEITVHSFEYVSPTEFEQPEAGFRFAAIDVEGCANPDSNNSAGLNPYDFSLQMPDNTRLDGDFYVKEPVLNDTTILPGDCVRGWITFQVSEGTTPTDVIFTSSSIIKWSVQEVASEAQSPEEILGLQYEYINLSDYESAYSLFAEQSKQLVSLEQYKAFFQSFDYYFIEDYSFPSVQTQEDSTTLDVVFTISDSTETQQNAKTQQLVREDGSWRVVMRDEQVAAFTGVG